MKQGRMSRRDFQRQLSLFIVAVATGTACSESADERVDDSALGGLASLLAHGESAAAIGAVFLAKHPEERDLEALAARLGFSADTVPAPDSPALAACAAAIHARHIHDFREGRLKEIAGWRLSFTELRLAAIVHLSSPV